MKEAFQDLKYGIFDPTGNITALVESEVDTGRQPEAAAAVMKRHAEVEQVGFVRICSGEDGSPEDAVLRMAGGEFCGNAAICAAALFMTRTGGEDGGSPGERTLKLRISGAERPVKVRVEKKSGGVYRAGVCMPPPAGTKYKEFAYGNVRSSLPVVTMQGISHIIIEKENEFYPLLADRDSAENAVKKWCRELSADGLGLMFLERSGERVRLIPLVFIPGGDTVFWEHSCASGTAAAGIFLSGEMTDPSGAGKDFISFDEPGGELIFKKDSVTKDVWLFGNVRIRSFHEGPG